MTKILVTGGNGMLATYTTKAAVEAGVEVISVPRDKMDISSLADVIRVLPKNRPDVIINCAGMTKGDNVQQMIRSNALGPHILYSVCKSLNIRMIQQSTDCVFDGLMGYYSEDCHTSPIDTYGYAKALGEVGDLIVRSSFVGFESGLLKWLVTNVNTKIPGYAGYLWNGLSVIQMGRILINLSLNFSRNGVIHVFGNVQSKYQLLESVAGSLGLSVIIVPEYNIKINRVLATNSVKISVPSWHIMLEELVSDYYYNTSRPKTPSQAMVR